MKVVAGSGGNGASTFHSEPRKEWGGPDGGNGGAGGDIIIKGNALNRAFTNLLFIAFRTHITEKLQLYCRIINSSTECFSQGNCCTAAPLRGSSVIAEFSQRCFFFLLFCHYGLSNVD